MQRPRSFELFREFAGPKAAIVLRTRHTGAHTGGPMKLEMMRDYLSFTGLACLSVLQSQSRGDGGGDLQTRAAIL